MFDQSQTTFFSKELVSSLSSKGQVTVPIKIRKYLGVTANDKVAFIIETTGDVKLAPARYPTIAALGGAAGHLKKPLRWKEVKQIANEDRLKEKYVK